VRLKTANRARLNAGDDGVGDDEADAIIMAVFIADAEEHDAWLLHRPGAFCGRFFRTCWFGIFSQAVEFQLQEMRRAGNTRVIIADGLLALPGERRVGRVQTLRNIAPQIGFDGLLVL